MKDWHTSVRHEYEAMYLMESEGSTRETTIHPLVTQWLTRQTSIGQTAEAWRFYRKHRGIVRDWNRTVMPHGLDWGRTKLFPLEESQFSKADQKNT